MRCSGACDPRRARRSWLHAAGLEQAPWRSSLPFPETAYRHRSMQYRVRMPELYGLRDGLNLDNLDVTTDEEINTYLTSARIGGHESVYGQRIVRGPLDPGPRYDMTANSLWLYTRPDCAKLHMRVGAGWRSLGNAGILTASSSANLHTYINQG